MCYFVSYTVPGCDFVVGDGIGSSEIEVGQADSSDECAASVYETHPSANGATYSNDGGTSCYAEFGVTSNNGNTAWQTCIFDSKFSLM